jgi:putative transposase
MYQFPVRLMRDVLGVHASGFYAWLKQPLSKREREDQYLLGFIKQFWLESGAVYGYRKIYDDLQSVGELCGRNRVYRLMKVAGIQSQRGYKRRHHYGGKPATVAPNLVEQQFDPDRPNELWVTDITYIRTYEGWLYLGVVLDAFSRQIVGWSMQQRITTSLVMDALTMALWRRRPKEKVIVHSDQGVQYTSSEWRSYLKANNLEASMSRRGNCHDNAVVESFFQLLKRERIKRRIYRTRDEAKRDVFDYIELFYNPKRRHGYNGNLSPIEFERNYFKKLESV